MAGVVNPALTARYKSIVRRMWDARSTTYTSTLPKFHGPLVRDLIELAPLRRGQSVLDLATGTGEAALAAAAAVGSTGVVVGFDISAGMIAEVPHAFAVHLRCMT